ncbi:endonuclease domain-containing protein [Nocardia gipuzkoensis]|uniref:endonuclease domain-containing protein n=1 Tax=Nocardia gipuzkoensis TaxID=2749991 RepID=UPI0015EF921E|nr:endonuclease domain-containing protein [Nocardia gipuzkoensis]
MLLVNGPDGPEFVPDSFEEAAIRLDRTPELWLEHELSWLRTKLLDAAGLCRAHVVAPDGVTHIDAKRPWNKRSWAVFRRTTAFDRKRPHMINYQLDSSWVLVRTTTKPEPPRLDRGHKACRIQHTTDAAERGARQRAAAARKKLGEDSALVALVEQLKQLDRTEWSRLSAHLPPQLTQLTLRRIMVELLLHLQGNQCAVCDTRTSGRILLPRGFSYAVLDHDHATDLVRGALCCRCNSAEGGGLTTWTAELEPRLEAYRANPPAAAFGWYYGQPEPRTPWW